MAFIFPLVIQLHESCETDITHKHFIWVCHNNLCSCFFSHVPQHTQTHTHTLCFHVLKGLSIDIMLFILYKLYILSPYTNRTPKPTRHRKLSAFLRFQKTSLSMIYKLFSSWGPNKFNHKDNDFRYCHLCGDMNTHTNT